VVDPWPSYEEMGATYGDVDVATMEFAKTPKEILKGLRVTRLDGNNGIGCL